MLRHFLLVIWVTFKHPITYFKLKFGKDLKLNLGSGIHYLENYINIDKGWKFKKDYHSNFSRAIEVSNTESLQVVLTSHVINYLPYSEFSMLAESIYDKMKSGGIWIIENPDFEKIIKYIKENEKFDDQFIEGIRAIFAFDKDQFNQGQYFEPYRMAYRKKDLINLLEDKGFIVAEKNPKIHRSIFDRDLRLEAHKP